MNKELNYIRTNICLEEVEREIHELENKMNIYEEHIKAIQDILDEVTHIDLDVHIRTIKKDLYEIRTFRSDDIQE